MLIYHIKQNLDNYDGNSNFLSFNFFVEYSMKEKSEFIGKLFKVRSQWCYSDVIPRIKNL